MLQSMVQNVSDEEDDTWGIWTAQGNSQQAPSQAPTTCLRHVELDSRERSKRIARRVQVFLDSGYKCFSQARCLAEITIDNHNWLQKSELDKIKAECKNKCCNSRTNELHYHEPQKCPDSSRSATSSAIHGSVNTAIPEAATKHSLTRRLLTLANENPRSSEAATEHSKIPEAACQEAKRLRKSGKGTGSHARTPSPDPEELPALASENAISGEAATEHSEIPETACQEAKRPRKSGKGNKKRARTPGKGTDLHARTASKKRARTPGKGTDFHARTASPTPTKIWTPTRPTPTSPTPTEVPSDNEQIQ